MTLSPAMLINVQTRQTETNKASLTQPCVAFNVDTNQHAMSDICCEQIDIRSVFQVL